MAAWALHHYDAYGLRGPRFRWLRRLDFTYVGFGTAYQSIPQLRRWAPSPLKDLCTDTSSWPSNMCCDQDASHGYCGSTSHYDLLNMLFPINARSALLTDISWAAFRACWLRYSRGSTHRLYALTPLMNDICRDIDTRVSFHELHQRLSMYLSSIFRSPPSPSLAHQPLYPPATN